MNGAQALLKNLVDAGIEICFANPGTSELYLVTAMGETDAVHPILCLFEGVVTGAADGYGRMADKPAITLLHLGSGFSNSMANLHNAKRANVPIVNIVGNHAAHHLQYDAPLTSDVPAHARICSDWVKVSESADDLAGGWQCHVYGSGTLDHGQRKGGCDRGAAQQQQLCNPEY